MRITRKKALVIADWILEARPEAARLGDELVRIGIEPHVKAWVEANNHRIIQPKAPPPPEPPGPFMRLAETLHDYRAAKQPACLVVGLRNE